MIQICKNNWLFCQNSGQICSLNDKPLRTHQENAWINNNIKRQITKRDRLFQKWLKTGSEVDHDLYKKSRNMITDSIRKAKYAYYQNTISKTGAQGIFKVFRQLQHKRTSSLKTSIDSDTFNKYFASIATVLSDKLPD